MLVRVIERSLSPPFTNANHLVRRGFGADKERFALRIAPAGGPGTPELEEEISSVMVSVGRPQSGQASPGLASFT